MIHPAEQICDIMARIYDRKLTTVSGGNLSIKDSEGQVWVSPSGGDKANLRREQVCQILSDGTVAGTAKPSLEFKIHKGIFDRRPDLKAILHAHSPALVAMSIMRRIPNTAILPDVRALTGEIRIAKYGLPGSEELVQNVSGVFAEGCNTVVLENHGIFIGSTKDLYDAYKTFETLDFLAQTEMMAGVLSGKQAVSLREDQMKRYGELMARQACAPVLPARSKNEEILLREQLCSMTRRAYDKNLFNSTQGVISARLSDGGMLITPEGEDHAYIDTERIVRVNGDECERDKKPHPLAFLHKMIYDAAPDVQSIICAISPYAGAFVVTGEPYDVRLIPECFNRLQSCKNFEFTDLLEAPGKLAAYLRLASPVAIINNAFYIIVSVSPFAAYDRMEIFEYTARSIHYCKNIGGEVVNITDEQVEALKKRFQIPKPEKVAL